MTKASATLSGSDHTLRSLAVRVSFNHIRLRFHHLTLPQISDSHSGDPGSIPGEEESSFFRTVFRFRIF